MARVARKLGPPPSPRRTNQKTIGAPADEGSQQEANEAFIHPGAYHPSSRPAPPTDTVAIPPPLVSGSNMTASPSRSIFPSLHSSRPASPGVGHMATMDAFTSSALPPVYAKTAPSEHEHHHSGSIHHQKSHHHSVVPVKLKRVDTQDLKSKLASALGNNGKRYWSALLDFMTARIDRIEFEEEATLCLKPQHVHLHNSLVLGLLYNASADVPGPSSPRIGHGHQKRDANGTLVGANGEAGGSQSDEEPDEPINQVLAPPQKRLRLLTAGLSRKERVRIKNVPKAMTHSRALAGGATSSLGWAGAGADMLEKKRKDEEKRRSMEEKKRVKEVYTQIGAKDWRNSILSGTAQIASVHDRLSLTTQQEIARALAAPLCVEAKELPDVDRMRDYMTLQAVEEGLPRGAQPQAAALLLAALQNHLQNVTSSIITKIRANRQMGIRTASLQRVTSDEYHLSSCVPLGQGQVGEENSSFDMSTRHSPVAKATRTMASDLSSLSSSSASLDLHTSTSNSLADSSMISLASTAPTSLPPPSVTSSEEAVRRGLGPTKAGEREGEDEEQDQLDSMTSSDQRREESIADANNSLELRHLSFLFNVAPHTVVEPLGLGTQERLLASDWMGADEDALREQEWSSEGLLLRESRAAATAKMSALPSSTPSTPRSAYIVDQLAPVRLFDRKTLMETQATLNSGGRNTKGGLSLPQTTAGTTTTSATSTATTTSLADGGGDENKNIVSAASSIFPTRTFNGGHQHHRGMDPHLYDVVDPVALLGSMVK